MAVKRILSGVICAALLFASTTVYAQDTPAETECVDAFLSFPISAPNDDNGVVIEVEHEIYDTHYYEMTIFTKTFPVKKKYTTVVVDGSYRYAGFIYLQSYTVTYDMQKMYTAHYAGDLKFNALMVR